MRAFSKYSAEAVRLLGQEIRLARRLRKWSESELAERAGVSRSTVQKVERGDMGTQIGLAFELAALVGVPLFARDHQSLRREVKRVSEMNALLPNKTHAPKDELRDDF